MKDNEIKKRVLIRLAAVLTVFSFVSIVTACGSSTEQKSAGGNTISTTAPTSLTQEEGENMIKPVDLPQAMLDGRYESLHSQFSPSFKKQVSLEDFSMMGSEFTSGVEKFQPFSNFKLNGGTHHMWVTPSGDKGVSAAFDENDTIIGLQIQHLTSYPETDNSYTKNEFSPPFKEGLFVFWGGTNVLANYHYEYESQRYAYDFVQVKNDFTFEGDPSKNDSYHAFGKPILAPADGIVVSAVNDIADNEPVGVMNEKEPAGNMVVIDHGGEFSLLAHLKKGSVSVKVGDTVKRGQEIGLLGNSGNSSEAHLHFQVSDGKDLFTSKSIPINWKDGVQPVRGETFHAAP